jgi:hypothetical protein
MIDDRGIDKNHHQISGLIPWYVNGSIGELDRQKLDAHLLDCAVCRDDLRQERRIYEGMAAETGVEYMPTASLKRLHARLDELGAPPAAVDAYPVEQFERRRVPWQGLAAASVAGVAVALSVISAGQWMQLHARKSPPNYHTVTTSDARGPDEVIRAVFAPNITLVELQAILDEAKLRIISGPTEAGVYSLAVTSDRPVSSSLALLRGHETVRFAESTQPRVESRDSAGSGEPP